MYVGRSWAQSVTMIGKFDMSNNCSLYIGPKIPEGVSIFRVGLASPDHASQRNGLIRIYCLHMRELPP